MADGGRVALVSARDDLRASVVRLAALAGVSVEVVADSVSVRAVWRVARTVVIGADLAAAVASADLPRRAQVVIIAPDDPDPDLWRTAVQLGATQVLTLPTGEGALVELLTDAAEVTQPTASSIAVIGACGGAGASTLAAALAVTAARANPTVLIDGDRLGGGIDVLLGAEHLPGSRWPDLAATRGRLGVNALGQSLVRIDQLAVLSFGRTGGRSGDGDVPVDAAGAVVDAALRGYPRIVVDLPRWLDGFAVVLATAVERVVMVVPATVRATAAASTVATQLLSHRRSIELVVRDPGGSRLSTKDVAGALGLSVAATFHSESAVEVAADRGETPCRRGRGSLADACRALLDSATTGQVAA